MVIDLRKVGNGVIMTRREEMRLKSSHLLREIYKIMDENFNYLIIPISIYNMIENHDSFRSERTTEDKDCLYHVGSWFDFEVYVDMTMPSNQILIRCDKQTRRDIRINKILNGIESIEELTIEVKDFSLEDPY